MGLGASTSHHPSGGEAITGATRLDDPQETPQNLAPTHNALQPPQKSSTQV
jgi:hypothetical protein